MNAKVLAPHYPWFRPTDSEYLVKRFDLASRDYSYFDWASYSWFDGDATTPRRNVTVCGELLFRSVGVEEAPGMPAGRLPGAEDVRVRPTHPSVVISSLPKPLTRY